jgi:hypothetical protein
MSPSRDTEFRAVAVSAADLEQDAPIGTRVRRQDVDGRHLAAGDSLELEDAFGRFLDLERLDRAVLGFRVLVLEALQRIAGPERLPGGHARARRQGERLAARGATVGRDGEGGTPTVGFPTIVLGLAFSFAVATIFRSSIVPGFSTSRAPPRISGQQLAGGCRYRRRPCSPRHTPSRRRGPPQMAREPKRPKMTLQPSAKEPAQSASDVHDR